MEPTLTADHRPRAAGLLAQLRVPWAFLLRDFRIEASYKAGFALRLVGVLLNIAIYYFIAGVFGGAAAPYLQPYGGSYFAFVVIGVAFNDYIALGISAIGERVRDGQVTGTLELMLLSPARSGVLLLSSSLWSYTFATLRVLAYLLLAAALGVPLARANLPLALLTLVVAVASANALGLLAASLVIVLKRGSPLDWALRVSSVVLGGVFYPVSVLPAPLRLLGQALPLTHALEILRRALLLGQGLAQLGGELLALSLLTAALLPLGLLACHLAIRLARADGSLAQY